MGSMHDPATRFAIEDVLHRYALGFDEDRLDLLVGCFVPDAVMESAAGVVAGTEAIRSAMRARRDARIANREQVRHLISNVLVDDAADGRLRVRSYFTLVATGPEGTAVLTHGTYDDVFAQHDGAWRIASRRTVGDAVGVVRA